MKHVTRPKVSEVLIVVLFLSLILVASRYHFGSTTQSIRTVSKEELREAQPFTLFKEPKYSDGDTVRNWLLEYVQDIEALESNKERYTAIIEMINMQESFSPELNELFPQRVTIEDNYNVQVLIKEQMNLENSNYQVEFILLKGDIMSPKEKLEVILVGDIDEKFNIFSCQGYMLGKRVYINPEIDCRAVEEENKITGLQVYKPPRPFNQRPRRIAVIIPYQQSSPLPQDYQSHMNAVLSQVQQFYLANSENIARFTYDLFPIQFEPLLSYPENIPRLITTADPMINYSLYDFVAIVVYTVYDTGYASIIFSNVKTPSYYNTNDGRIASAVPLSFFSGTQSTENAARIIKHETGHVLSFWNPMISTRYFFGLVPHARGFLQDTVCTPSGPQVTCYVDEYGDKFDTMGSGVGLFNYHTSVFRMGLRSTRNVRVVSGAGTTTLCDIHHAPPTGCPQELLFQNKYGINLAVEIRTPTGPDAYYTAQSCSPALFDGILIRAVDTEEGGMLGNTVYTVLINNGYGADALLTHSRTFLRCPQPLPIVGNIMDYTIPIGGSLQLPPGLPINSIRLQSLTSLPSGGKQATVLFQ